VVWFSEQGSKEKAGVRLLKKAGTAGRGMIHQGKLSARLFTDEWWGPYKSGYSAFNSL